MKICGHGLLEVSQPKDAKWFLDMYEQSHWENIVQYQTFRVTELRLKDYKYVAFIQAGGGIDRLIKMEEGDFLRFYAQEGLDGYSNTCGMAFVRCYQRNEAKYDYDELAMFCMDNSPYDIDQTDSEWPYIWDDEAGDEIREDLVLFLGEGHDSTLKNTLFITQL